MRHLFTLLLCTAIYYCAHAQEICGNGIDDDGNGLIDCYDPACAGSSACTGSFYGFPAYGCQYIPPVGPFGIQQLWSSTVSVSTRSIALVGDIDADGVTEVIVHNSAANQLYILNGITGAVELTITCPAINDLSNAFAMADTDNDGFGELYVVDNTSIMHCFEHTGAAKTGYTAPNVGSSEATPGIADFNGDGIAEVYIGNTIYNSQTGALLATAGAQSAGNNPGTVAKLSVAADVLPNSFCTDCQGLELVCGNKVYAYNSVAGTLTAQPNNLPGTYADGFTAIADIDLDGSTDVIVTSAGKVYVWNPITGNPIGTTFAIPNSTTGGRPNVADYNNDGKPEIGVGGRNVYVAIAYNSVTNTLNSIWQNTIIDASQQTTGTAFDFEGDGITEVIYRDEATLYIYDGSTGAVKASVPCGSGTRTEFPTIADVDGDKQADIVCNCGNDTTAVTGNVFVYKSNNNQWISSRKVMNQHAYHITNINDDLSVPQVQQANSSIQQLNNFLNQAPLYDVNWGQLFVPVPDLSITIDTFNTCQALNTLSLTVTICNQGSGASTDTIPVSFYNGNPLSGGNLIATQYTTITVIDTASCTTQQFNIPYNNTSFMLYAVVNDLGTSNVGAPALLYYECDSTNNIGSRNITTSQVPLSLYLADRYCYLDTALQLQALPSGGTFSGNGVFNDNFYPYQAGIGTHTVTYTYQHGVCTFVTDTTVEIFGFPVANAGNDTTVCINMPVVLGTDSVPGASYFWIWPNNLNSFQLAQPTGIYDSVGNYTYIMYITVNGCYSTDTVTVNATTVGNANAHLDWETCVTDTLIQFANGTPSGGIWRGYGVIDSVMGKFSPAMVGVGEHPVTYNTWQVCPATDTLIVKVLALANVGLTADTTICAGEQVQLEATGGYMFFWEPTTYLTNAGIYEGTPVSSTPISITYSVTVMNDTTCPNMDSVRITVVAPPTAGFSIDTVCEGTASTITDLATPQGSLSYTWIMGNGNTVNDTLSSYSYAAGGLYHITQIVQQGNCTDTAYGTAVVDHQPMASFTIDTVCQGTTTTINDLSQAQGSPSYTWYMGDGTTLNATTSSHLYNTAGTYQVMLVLNLGKCTDTAIQYALINDIPWADFNYAIDSQSVSFNNTTQGGDSWEWLLGDGNISNIQNPSHQYSQSGSYNVWLVAVTNSGCSDSAMQVIVIPTPIDTAVLPTINDAMFIPNAFSPNGDGYNDVWEVFTNTAINYFEVSIYNRWGEKVYESNNQTQGWDGRYKGELQTPQNFVYTLNVVLQNGERRTLKGSLLLMK